MAISRTLAALLLALLATPTFAQQADFTWNWRDQEVIGRTDASVGNSSKLTEPERAALIDALVLRLQKPMIEAGYDDDRIREIASTTRIRLVDFGGGNPLVFTTSLGMEGGCDPRGNCPLWIFRRGKAGFTSMLDAVAASYTLQSGDLVLMHHLSQKQSGLQVYRLEDGKLSQSACYEANSPAPSDDPTQLSDPEIVPCKEGTVEPTPLTPQAKPETPAETAPKPDTPEAQPVAPEAKPDVPATPDAKPLPDAPQPQTGDANPAAPSEKPEPAQMNPAEPPAAPETPPADMKPPAPEAPVMPDAKPPLPDAPQPPADDAKPTPDQTQPPAPDAPTEPQPAPAAPEARPDAPSKPDALDQPPPAPETPPGSQPKPGAPDPNQAPAQTPAPDPTQQAPKSQ